jgi:hypothetical protein
LNGLEGRPLVAARRHRIIDAEIPEIDIDEKYGVEEAEKKYAEWDKLMQHERLLFAGLVMEPQLLEKN